MLKKLCKWLCGFNRGDVDEMWKNVDKMEKIIAQLEQGHRMDQGNKIQADITKSLNDIRYKLLTGLNKLM